MLFVCAHPAIHAAIRTPLMLQTVLGFDANRIGAAFLLSGATMGQRLVRSKSKIRDAGIPFGMPEPEEMTERLADVLQAIYAAFTIGWSDVDAIDADDGDFVREAMFLARIVVDSLPDQPEPMGLLALMVYCEARRPARTTPVGRFVPLAEQDTRLWSADKIAHAEQWLTRAAVARRPGRYQTEAGIQSYHVQASQSPDLPLTGLLDLYDALARQTCSLGAAIARAAAYCRSGRAAEALDQIGALPFGRIENHQPFWVARADILLALGRTADAVTAFDRAIHLTDTPRIRAHLESKRAAVRPT